MDVPNNGKWWIIFFMFLIAGTTLKIFNSPDGGYLLGIAGGIAIRNFGLTFEKPKLTEVNH